MTTTTTMTNVNGRGRCRPSAAVAAAAAATGHNPKRPRLRAATTISSPLQHHYRFHHYYPPSNCMSVRRTGAGRGGGGTHRGKSLAAIAGPMGITVVDVSSPQLRPWLALDYGSFNNDGNGGITTMAFQPCPSSQGKLCNSNSIGDEKVNINTTSSITTSNIDMNNNSTRNYYHYSYNESSILLATARGSGILIWDCSGRILSPLLGRLNASNDSWPDDNTTASATKRNTVGVGGRHEDHGMVNKQHQQQQHHHHQQQQQAQTPAMVESSNSACTFPIEDAPTLTNVRGDFNTVSSPVSAPMSKGKHNIVTSLEWKGPSAPILLSTCGDYACVWDLRTSIFSGTGVAGGGSGGARPNARYHHPPSSSTSVGSSMLIHCAYCHDESNHSFATLNSMGVVSVWDDRKADRRKNSFLACPGGGVGIASIAPPRSGVGGGIGLRWVTWGMEDGDGYSSDDLVVKVWSDSGSTRYDSGDIITTAPYHVTSRIAMAGAVSARVHPSFADGVLLFRENFSTKEQPSTVLKGADLNGDEQEHDIVGWEAELWRIDTDVIPSTTAGIESAANDRRVEGSQNARKVVAFRGGGAEEDALSFAPGRVGDAGDVIAVELTMGASSVEDDVDELSVCVLTKAGRLTVYGVIDASTNAHDDATTHSNPDIKLQLPKTTSSVYKGTTDHGASNEWWKNNEEEELFGDSNTALERPTTKPVIDDSPQMDRVSDDICKIATASSVSADVGIGSDVAVDIRAIDPTNTMEDLQNMPFDPIVASRVPCPPLCGVAFSGVGSLVIFSNGPVQRLWQNYQSHKLISQPNKSHIIKTGNNVTSRVCNNDGYSFDDQNAPGHQTCDDDGRKSNFPKTLADLIDMNLRSQTLQWGDGDNLQMDDDDAPVDCGRSSISDESSSYEDGDLLTLDSDKSSTMHESEGSECSADKFDEYFSSSRQSLLGTDQNVAPGVFVGLPTLSPSVAVTYQYRHTLLSNQMPQLANLLMLGGEGWLSKDFSGNSVPLDSSALTVSIPFSDTLPSRPPSEHATIMGNLKFFANQLPTAMTPPDQRLLHTAHNKMHSSSVMNENRPNSNQMDVYMLPNSQISETASKQLAVSHQICLHNAEVCSQLGQKAKADTWTLLAQTLDSVFTFEQDETDGWGSDGDALTTGVVEQILRYYEGQGDFQMLATIVCVLNFGRNVHFPVGDFGRRRLLPRFDERRYDNYLHHYAALLYGWGFLNAQTDISKRRLYPTPGARTETTTLSDRGRSKPVLLANKEEGMGVTFTPVCGTCMEQVTDNVCRNCSEYPFRCSICCNVVHGMSTWCPICGHGGHFNHITQWFQSESVCPTGCGCVCLNGAIQ